MNWVRWFPFLRWFPMTRETVRSDALAGLTVSLLLVPQAMAYAQLAGLPPHYGLYTAFVPMVVAALFGWCSQLHTGPVAMTSLLVGSVLTGLGVAAPESPEYVGLAIALSLVVGIVRVLFGLMRLAVVVNLLSHPVISGFTNAGAMIIALSQAHLLLGISSPRTENFLAGLVDVLQRVRESHVPTILLAGLSVVLMVGLRRWKPRWPGVLITVALATAISWLIGFESRFGGQVVGVVPAGLPPWHRPEIPWAILPRLVPDAALIVMIGFMEVVAISKVIVARTRESLDLDQEMVGQGLACIAGSFVQAYPVSGSFSRSALNLYAGARTGLASVFAGLMVLGVLLFLTPVLYHLPRAVLGGVIVVAVAGLVDVHAVVRAWHVSRFDGISAVVTFVGAIALAPRIVEGILLGVAISVAFHLFQVMRPHVAVLGHHPDGTMRDARRHQLAIDPRILAVRFDGRLIFANASHFEESILAARATNPGTRAVIVVCSGINAIDATGVETLRNVVLELRENGVRVMLAEVRGGVMDVLARTGLRDVVGDDAVFPSVELAWEAASRTVSGGNKTGS